MARLNLTLDDDTAKAVEEHARAHKKTVAALGRELIREALAARETLARRRALAADYAEGRADARELLDDFEAPQLALLDELLDDDDARA